MGLLDGDIAGIIGSATGFLMLDATLRKTVIGAFNPATQKRATSSVSNYTVKGFIDEDLTNYKEYVIAQEASAMALIIQSGAPAAPSMGDQIILRGTWRIVSVMEDPASATWMCGVAGAGDEA